MANVLVSIEKGIEIGAEDLFKWITQGATITGKVGPAALAALGVLAGAIEKALSDTAAAAANPGSLVLTFGSDLNDIKAVWPDIKSFLETLGVKV